MSPLYPLPEGEIKRRIREREVGIAIVGLGRVGLPLAATLAGEGFKVVGVDVNEKVVSLTNRGEAYFKEETGLPELLRKVVGKGKLRASTEVKEVDACDLITITVPTLLTKNKIPDISAVFTAGRNVARFCWGKVISLESTVPPFTTLKLGRMIEKQTGWKAGKDFGLAYSPERVQAPQVLRDLRTYPKIVAGIDEKSTFILSEIYSSFAPSIIKMSSLVAAEIEKVVENTYRDVNIAFANELAKICEIYGVDVFEIIKVANSQPFSHILNPGCGVGGHCIPIVPFYLIKDVERKGYEPLLLKVARIINDSMPEHVAKMVRNHLGGGKVTILGLSFKPNVKAFNYSPTLKIIELLKNYDVVVHDPFLNNENFNFKTEKNIYKAIKGSDCLLLSTAHSTYKRINFKKVKKLMRGNLVIDGRGFFDPTKVKEAKLIYRGIGRP